MASEQVEYWKARAEKAEQEKRVLRMLLNRQKAKSGMHVLTDLIGRQTYLYWKSFPLQLRAPGSPVSNSPSRSRFRTLSTEITNVVWLTTLVVVG